MERDTHQPGDQSGATPQEERHDEAVERRTRPARHQRHRVLLQQRADEGQVRPPGQPETERQPVGQPVTVQLREPGEAVDDADLEADQPDRPERHAAVAVTAGVDRPGRRHRQEHHQRAGERHEPVVVEVDGRLDQLQPREREPERDDRDAVPAADHDAEGGHRHDAHQQVDAPLRWHRHPLEPRVPQVDRRRHEQGVDPAPGDEPHRAEQPDRPEGDAHDGQRLPADG